jgi:GNAT superfamily N-acetyltransferase
MRANEFITESINPAEAWVKKVYDMYPDWPYGQADKVMVWGEGEDQQFAAFKLKPLSHRDRPTVELSWIMAGPEQRQGVGSRAIKELQRMATEDGIRLTLFPWAHGKVSQPKLMKLYKRHGFRPQNKGSKHMQWEPEMNELAGIKKHVNQIQQNYDTGAGMPDPHDDEIDYYDAMDDPSVQNRSVAYENILEKHGFIQVGSGAYATVWSRPNLNYVLKVFREDDRSYRAWASICLTNKNNTNLPKLLSRKPIKITNYFYAVRMEKLTECNQQLRSIIRDISRLVYEIHENLSIRNANDVKSYIAGEGLDRDKDEYNYPNLLYYITNVDTGIVNAIWLVIQAVRNQSGYPDLGIRNFMMRGDTLVFTDPLA